LKCEMDESVPKQIRNSKQYSDGDSLQLNISGRPTYDYTMVEVRALGLEMVGRRDTCNRTLAPVVQV
jgi:hypothetical protein